MRRLIVNVPPRSIKSITAAVAFPAWVLGQDPTRRIICVSYAEELARKRGCFRMSLVTAGWREDTHRFYDRLGWDDYGKWFVKSLVDDVAPSGQPLRDDT